MSQVVASRSSSHTPATNDRQLIGTTDERRWSGSGHPMSMSQLDDRFGTDHLADQRIGEYPCAIRLGEV